MNLDLLLNKKFLKTQIILSVKCLNKALLFRLDITAATKRELMNLSQVYMSTLADKLKSDLYVEP